MAPVDEQGSGLVLRLPLSNAVLSMPEDGLGDPEDLPTAIDLHEPEAIVTVRVKVIVDDGRRVEAMDDVAAPRVGDFYSRRPARPAD